MRPVQRLPCPTIPSMFNGLRNVAEAAAAALRTGHQPALMSRGMILRGRHLLRSRRGATAIEFALVGSLLMTFLIGIIEVGRYMITREAVRNVTAEAVRLATLRGAANLNGGAAPCQSLSGSLGSAVRGGPMLRPADLSVILSGCATAGGMTSVVVTVTYPFSHAVPLVAARSMLLQEQGTATIF